MFALSDALRTGSGNLGRFQLVGPVNAIQLHIAGDRIVRSQSTEADA